MARRIKRTRTVGAWRSGSAPALGAGGRWFESSRPDITLTSKPVGPESADARVLKRWTAAHHERCPAATSTRVQQPVELVRCRSLPLVENRRTPLHVSGSLAQVRCLRRLSPEFETLCTGSEARCLSTQLNGAQWLLYSFHSGRGRIPRPVGEGFLGLAVIVHRIPPDIIACHAITGARQAIHQ
jgi:hypothetical protein